MTREQLSPPTALRPAGCGPQGRQCLRRNLDLPLKPAGFPDPSVRPAAPPAVRADSDRQKVELGLTEPIKLPWDKGGRGRGFGEPRFPTHPHVRDCPIVASSSSITWPTKGLNVQFRNCGRAPWATPADCPEACLPEPVMPRPLRPGRKWTAVGPCTQPACLSFGQRGKTVKPLKGKTPVGRGSSSQVKGRGQALETAWVGHLPRRKGGSHLKIQISIHQPQRERQRDAEALLPVLRNVNLRGCRQNLRGGPSKLGSQI